MCDLTKPYAGIVQGSLFFIDAASFVLKQAISVTSLS